MPTIQHYWVRKPRIPIKGVHRRTCLRVIDNQVGDGAWLVHNACGNGGSGGGSKPPVYSTVKVNNPDTPQNMVQVYNVNGQIYEFGTGHAYNKPHGGVYVQDYTGGLSAQEIESRIIDDLQIRISNGTTFQVSGKGTSDMFTVTINNVTLKYRVVQKPDGTITVGNYYQ